MSNNEPLVSVIIPLYNAEKFLSETIESVIAQTYKNWELIVVDDCSTDASRDIVKKFEVRDNRIRLIKSQTNFGGPARPRNIGVENSKGTFIAFLDADDVWLPKKLKYQLQEMQKNKLNFTSTVTSFIDKNSLNIDYKYKFWVYHEKIRQKRNVSDLIKKNFISTSSVLVDKELISSFDESKECIAVEDFFQWLNILRSSETKYKYIDVPLVQYRKLENSISNKECEYRHDTKANMCVLKFILGHNDFYLLRIFYLRQFKIIMRNSIKNILGK